MTPSAKARSYGCGTLSEASKVSGVPRRTLEDWSRTKPFVFEAVCKLVAAGVKCDCGNICATSVEFEFFGWHGKCVQCVMGGE